MERSFENNGCPTLDHCQLMSSALILCHWPRLQQRRLDLDLDLGVSAQAGQSAPPPQLLAGPAPAGLKHPPPPHLVLCKRH